MNLIVRYYISFAIEYRIRPGRDRSQWFSGNGLESFLRRRAQPFLRRWWGGRCGGSWRRLKLRWIYCGRWNIHCCSFGAYHNRCSHSARQHILRWITNAWWSATNGNLVDTDSIIPSYPSLIITVESLVEFFSPYANQFHPKYSWLLDRRLIS